MNELGLGGKFQAQLCIVKTACGIAQAGEAPAFEQFRLFENFYFPWEGRHTGVLGVEDVTSWFHYGLSESVRPNSFSRRGIPTHRDLLDLSNKLPRCVYLTADIDSRISVNDWTTDDAPDDQTHWRLW